MGLCLCRERVHQGKFVEATYPLKLGLISDIQYADADDGTDFAGDEKRYFRNVLRVVDAAVTVFNGEAVDAVVTMGDAIDGRNARAGETKCALQKVLDVLSRSTAAQRFDLVGNHELYNFPREHLAGCGLRCTGESGKFYWSSPLSSTWEAVFLDILEISVMGLPNNHPSSVAAIKILQENNPKVVSSLGGGDWLSGLPIEKYRYVPYNGAASEKQISWLRETLKTACEAGRNVLIFTHVPLYQPATKPETVAWNADEIMCAVHDYSSTVIAVMAGHDHSGGYAVDPAGIHHLTLNSPLTAPPGLDPPAHCFSVLECHDTWAHLRCYGRALVESGTKGAGRSYPELVLGKGARNEPSGPALGA